MKCSLCFSDAVFFIETGTKIYYKCLTCNSVMVSPEGLPDRDSEKSRYLKHRNDTNDKGYRSFVKPLTQVVLSNQNSSQHGLDYGSGTGPVAAAVLNEHGYNIALFDPFFKPDASVLKQNYDYIICCEVMEHFHEPAKEFKLLSGILNTGGNLFCKTNLFTEQIDFKNWWYKNDLTHVFFYSADAIHYIADHYHFKCIRCDNELIHFKKE